MNINKISVHNKTVRFDDHSLYISMIGLISTASYACRYGLICHGYKFVEFGDIYGNYIYGMSK